MKRKDVGGQAVIEGVMMRGSKGMAIAVRKEDGEIDVKVEKVVPLTKKYKFLNIPLIRGIFVLVDSLKIGMDSLNHSASFVEEDEDYEPESKFEKLLDKFEGWLRKKYGEKAEDIIMSITMGIAFLLAIGLFIGLPTAIATIFKGFGISPILLNLIEAAIRISILIIYIWGIAKLDDMYRVFQYHGAEHKTIFCYEAEEELTVENVKKFSRFHPRCGTNFLFLIMFVSVFIFSFTGWGGFLQRIILRILLIPIVAGITYEIIKWLGKSNGVLARIISYPGLKLQGLTTREPDDKQIEVAIASLKAAEGIEDKEKTIGELLNEGTKILGDAAIDTSRLDSQLLLGKVLEKDKLYLITNSTEKVSNSNKVKYFDLINDELVLIAPIDLNIDNDNGYIDIDELNKLKFIMRKEGSGTRNLTFNMLKGHNFNINNLNILAYVESNETIKEMVKIGLGVSFISYKSAKDYIKNNKLKFYRVKNINFARKFYFIYSKKKAFSPLENKFLSSLCEYFDIKREID